MDNLVTFTRRPKNLPRRALVVGITCNREFRCMAFLPSGNVWRTMPIRTNFMLKYDGVDNPPMRMSFTEQPPVQKVKKTMDNSTGVGDIAGVHDFNFSNQGLTF